MTSDFEITNIEVHPYSETGTSQYIQVEVKITQQYGEQMFAAEIGAGEKYSGEGIGLI